MCFSIPLQVLQVKGDMCFLEGGKIVRSERNLQIKRGDFVQIAGNLIVDKITGDNGLKIRRLIKRLNS